MSTQGQRESWEAQKPKLTRLQQKTYDTLLTFPDGACCWEIMEKWGTKNPNEVAPKLSKLKEFGLVVEIDLKRKCPYSRIGHSVYKDAKDPTAVKKKEHILLADYLNGDVVVYDLPEKIIKKLKRGLRANITIKLKKEDEENEGN